MTTPPPDIPPGYLMHWDTASGGKLPAGWAFYTEADKASPLRLVIKLAGKPAAPDAVRTKPCPFRLCMVRYKFHRGAGPWNYCMEEPPEDVRWVYALGYYIGKTDAGHGWHLTASDLYVDSAGDWHAVRHQHWPLDADIRFYESESTP